MQQGQKIRMLAAYKCTSLAKLSRSIGQAPPNFHQKLTRNTFTDEELSKIADVLGVEYVPFKFVCKDGTEI